MVHSNIVRFKLKGKIILLYFINPSKKLGHSQEDFIARCGDESCGVQVKILIVSGGFIRAVFHNDAKGDAVSAGLKKIEKLLSEMK